MPVSAKRLEVPWQIWVVVVLLGLEGIGNLLDIPGNFEAAQRFLWKCLFLVGLIRGWRPVFVLVLALSVLHVVGFATHNLFAASLNLLLVVLVGSTRRWFFDRPIPGPGKAKPGGSFDPDFDLA